MSAAVSPGMKVETARRTNGALTPCSRIHWLSEILSRAVRARLMPDHDTMSAVCAATDPGLDGIAAMTPHVVVIGAGAAGLMAASRPARPARRSTLVERTADGGRKILISGGGRCNVLPSDAAPGAIRQRSATRRWCAALLGAWPLREQRRFFERDLGTAAGARGPPAASSSRRRTAPATCATRLVGPRARTAAWRCDSAARSTGGASGDGGVAGSSRPRPASWRATRVIIATGGLSVPTTGSDGFGLGSGPRARPRRATHLRRADAAHRPARRRMRPCRRVARRAARRGVPARERAARRAAGSCSRIAATAGRAVLDVSHVAVRSQWPGAERGDRARERGRRWTRPPGARCSPSRAAG